METIINNIPAMICITVAGVLAYSNIGGWGYFLSIGFLLTFYKD